MSKPLLEEEDVERAVLLQSEEACQLRGAARAEHDYWADHIKELEARLVQDAPMKGAEAAKAWARSRPEYATALKKKKEAAKTWYAQQEAGNAAERILDVWRTLKADARRSNFQ